MPLFEITETRTLSETEQAHGQENLFSVSSSGNGPRLHPPGKRLIAIRKIVNGRLTAAV
jgi:hypothetical protein